MPQADPHKRITRLLVDWDSREDVWKNLLSYPSERNAHRVMGEPKAPHLCLHPSQPKATSRDEDKCRAKSSDLAAAGTRSPQRAHRDGLLGLDFALGEPKPPHACLLASTGHYHGTLPSHQESSFPWSWRDPKGLHLFNLKT